MPFVYILKSEFFSKTYIGSTSDLNRRILEHNKGLAFFTKRFKPWKLIYQEKYDKLEDARRREKYFKSAAGRRFIKKHNIIPR